MKSRLFAASLSIPLILLAGCQSSGTDFVASMQPKALLAAEAKGKADLTCPAAKGTVQGGQRIHDFRNVDFSMPDLAVYNIAVVGCDKRVAYAVSCPNDGSSTCTIGPR